MENELLAALPGQEYKRLLPLLEGVSLAHGEILFQAGTRLQYVYFPRGALISLASQTGEGISVEVARVGREGFIGIPVLLESEAALCQAEVQIPGDAWRLEAATFQEQLAASRVWQRLLLRYAHAFLTQAIQLGICNRFHSIKERLCCWLLVTHDWAASGDDFRLTQQYIARTLCVRRASISEAATGLQQIGVIRYHRGQIRILDRQRLESAACSCYQVIKHLSQVAGGH